MPRRKPEFVDQKRQQIIDGALKVFARKGFAKATNRDVAEAAGINSPGLIYHYFKDKADLLRAVVESHALPIQMATHAEEIMDLPPETVLTQFGRNYLRLLDDSQFGDALKLILGEAIRDVAFAKQFGEIGPLRAWGFLSEYLQHQMNQGTLRPCDPNIAVRCFMGPLILHVMTNRVLQITEETEIAPDALLTMTVEIFLRGMQPEGE